MLKLGNNKALSELLGMVVFISKEKLVNSAFQRAFSQ